MRSEVKWCAGNGPRLTYTGGWFVVACLGSLYILKHPHTSFPHITYTLKKEKIMEEEGEYPASIRLQHISQVRSFWSRAVRLRVLFLAL